jgi:spectinomycin phosphotransferase
MLEPPDFPDERILAAVRANYGIPATALTFLPIGCNSLAWAYRAETADGRTYFLKLRKGIGNPAGLQIPRHLRDDGVAHVIAPIPTSTRSLWADVDEFALILYPFIDGTSGRDHGMTERHWVTYGAVLRQIHDAELAPELERQLRRETFTPDWGDVVRRLDTHVGARRFRDVGERELGAFWLARRSEIRALLDRAEVLGRRLRDTEPPLVLCHADIHTWNVMIDTADRFWIVDWDEAVLAPRERDLMFVVGGIVRGLVGQREQGWFFDGYGPTAVDPLALAYYRYAWAVGDIGGFGESVFLIPDTGEVTKRDAVAKLISLFDPGNIVALAYAADRFDP